MTESTAERIKKIEEKMAQLKAQKQALFARHKTVQRKTKTQRLIQIRNFGRKTSPNPKYVNRRSGKPYTKNHLKFSNIKIY